MYNNRCKLVNIVMDFTMGQLAIFGGQLVGKVRLHSDSSQAQKSIFFWSILTVTEYDFLGRIFWRLGINPNHRNLDDLTRLDIYIIYIYISTSMQLSFIYKINSHHLTTYFYICYDFGVCILHLNNWISRHLNNSNSLSW